MSDPPDADPVVARIDPELLDAFQRKVGVDLTDISRARATFEEGRRVADAGRTPNPDVVRIDETIPGRGEDPPVRIRQYSAADRRGESPCLLWIHGGGHVLGAMELDDPLAEHFVDRVGCVVVSVEWRKSPENPFPAAINDCYTALSWAYANAGRLGVDPGRIAVGGASSGGGSAAGLALLALDRGEIPVCFQLLTYPMLDDRNVTPSSHAITHPRLWRRATNLIAWKAYLGDRADGGFVSPYAAPSRARDLTGLPPTFMAVGDLDLFLDEDIDYAKRLIEAGVPTELHVYPGAFHGFDGLAPSSGVARRLVRDRSDALARAFGTYAARA